MRILSLKPNNPDQSPKKKYNLPISLWLVEANHRLINSLPYKELIK